ncbi:TetR/AcrR family transcriptional regulator [Nocardia asteroides]|uniref:TetR/AcrR family transcriptional regulator n=1 Tax=Nocardia asteroides TaxID=1824 RepID=UPI001E2D26FF|nr:TetR/AcrR family transcriptional regulator [Nocardia asteroides]UGT63005.1 TetR/AcrR family transcriptional regulator [Nocardia asteroides]
MAGRPIDHRRRAELLDAAVDHAADRGFAELSLRPMAAALGVSPTTLVHHFGSREQLLAAVLGRLRERVALTPGSYPDLATAARAVWEHSSDPEQRSVFRLFFAVYGSAVQAPGAYAEFLAQAGTELTAALCAAQGPEVDPAAAARRATLVIATLRGLLLDLLGGGDPARIHSAAADYLAGL